MFILKKGHQPGVYVPLRALFLVILDFFLGMRLLNLNNAYRRRSDICWNCAFKQRFAILNVPRNIISIVI